MADSGGLPGPPSGDSFTVSGLRLPPMTFEYLVAGGAHTPTRCEMTGLRRDELSDVKTFTTVGSTNSHSRHGNGVPDEISRQNRLSGIQAPHRGDRGGPCARTRAGSPGSPNTSQALTRIPLGEDRNECADGPAAELLPRCVHDRSHGVPGHFRKLIGESRDQVLESPRLVI